MDKKSFFHRAEQGFFFLCNLGFRLLLLCLPASYLGSFLRLIGGHESVPQTVFSLDTILLLWATAYVGAYFSGGEIIDETYVQDLQDRKYRGLFHPSSSLRWKYWLGLRRLRILAILAVASGLVGMVVTSVYFNGDMSIAQCIAIPLFALGTFMGFGRMKDSQKIVFCHPYAVTQYLQ